MFYLKNFNRLTCMGNAIKNISLYGFLILFIAFVSACQCETPTESIIEPPIDEPPTITNHVFIVTENATSNTVVGTVNASDNIGITSYAITAGNTNGATNTNAVFAIDNSGQLTTTSAIDYEATSNYNLTVQGCRCG